MRIFFAPLVLGLVLAQSAEAASRLGEGALGMPSTLPIDSRCSLSMGGNVIDYGTQSRWQLRDAPSGRNSVTFGKRTLTLSVACSYTQSIRLTLRGERSTSGDLRYGDRGSMIVRLFDAQMDGQSVQIIGTTPDGVINGAAADSRLLQPGESFAAIANGQLVRGKTFTAHLEIEPTLPEADARVSARQMNEANLTLELMN
ncbi:hypothetical protein C4K03_4756 [Pseudomonas synxantha]|uniref:Beta-fimbriae major subunit n=1 Tax=Pseudomonas synxantha TaxID=47883 RepID=A0A3G7UBY4_9PSED|nr:DUF1120 domain-containing protein [Pseudomonas synxantha]AZE56894.1 hypothetical protein C4K03_4756 [Pseudomonas synxantha]